MKCKKCNKENSASNFCPYCGSKLNQTCEKCWMKKGQAYNCNFEQCPGYKLPILEKLKS